MSTDIPKRLEELRAEIRAERISYGELAELQGLAEHIDPSDVELLEWAGVPEYGEDKSEFLTLTVVVRNTLTDDPSEVDVDELRALITPDETMFVSVEPGVTEYAVQRGADPQSWGD